MNSFSPPQLTCRAGSHLVNQMKYQPPTWRGARVSHLHLIALVTLMLLGACSRPAPPPEPIRAVKVVTVGASAVPLRQEFSGEIRARVESRLGFRVAGKLVRRQAEPGQRVTAGQLLAQLDPQDYKLATDAARAQVAAAQTNRDLAAAEFKRFTTLKEQNFISGAELERRETALKAAQAQLEQAQAQLGAQGNQSAYADLRADSAGVVLAVEAEPGQVVAAGTPVVRVAPDGVRDAAFVVPEDMVGQLRIGMAMNVRPLSGGDVLGAKVREIAASADPVTRTYLVKVALAGKAALPNLPLGSTVYVSLGSSAQPQIAAIKLPTSALKQDGKGTAVWVLDPASMTVKLQPVQVLMADGNEAVIGSGLQAGTLVVAAGVHMLQPGQKVMLYQERVAAAVRPIGLPIVSPTTPAASAQK